MAKLAAAAMNSRLFIKVLSLQSLANQRCYADGVKLISDALPFSRLWYGERDAMSNAIGYAKFYSRSHDAVIRVYDESGNVIEAHEHAGEFKEW
jgi:hypothetical protein